MAKKEEIVFEASVDATGKGAKSLASLKAEFKALQKQLEETKEGTKEYSQTLQKLGAVKDDIGDLRDTISALNPEGKIGAFSNVAQKLAGGFQAASGAAALFGKSGEDVQKVLLKVQAATAFADGLKSLTGLTDGFKILGQVIKANPILLIASVLISIGVAAYALKDKIAFLGKAFELAGQAISYVVQLGKDFLDQTGLTSFAMDDLADKMDKYSKAALEGANARQVAYKREIELLKAQGKETYELERQALKARLLADGSRMDSLAKQRAIGKKFSEDEQNEYDELVQKVLETNNQILVLDASHKLELQKRRDEEITKQIAERKKREEREKEANEKEAARLKKLLDDRRELEDKIAKEKEEKDEEERKKQEKIDTDMTNALKHRLEVEAQYEKIYADESRKLEEEKQKAKLQIQDQSLLAAKNLSDLYFTSQLKGVQKGSEEELKIRKKQFEVDKAFSIARATIDGIRAVQTSLASAPAPFGVALAAINATIAAANVAKIAATQFDAGGGSSAPSVGGGNSVGGSTAPVQTNAPNYQSVTNLSSTGQVQSNQMVVKAEVVETETTQKQKRVLRLKKQASFP